MEEHSNHRYDRNRAQFWEPHCRYDPSDDSRYSVSRMDTILSPDWKFEAWVSLILGVSVSQLLQVLPFEIDRHAYLVLPIYLGAASILLLILWIEPKAGLVTCLSRSGLAITFFNAGLFGYMLLCRAFFHKLRKFPGPWPAKLSKFYWTYQVLRDPISHLRVEKLHQELGDFVRTGKLSSFVSYEPWANRS